jgi:two-component system, NarL family, response regulator NreC
MARADASGRKRWAEVSPPRVVLADDHALVRQSLRLLLEREGLRVVGEAGDGGEAVRLIRRLAPDVAILDLAMGSMSGIAAAGRVCEEMPGTKTILLTMHGEPQYVRAALAAGVCGYVLKSQAVHDLLKAIRAVCRGETYLGSTLTPPPPPPAQPRLSRRQAQVLRLVAEGKSCRQIAESLGISRKTVEVHRTAVMRKLGVHRTAELVRLAVRMGSVEV